MLAMLVIASVMAMADPVPLAASVLPPSRHAEVGGDPVTFFVTLANPGAVTAGNCRIELAVPGATISYRAFDLASGTFSAAGNTPVDIPAGGAQVFVLAADFSAPLARTQFEPRYACDNGEALPVHGVTQITLTAAASSSPDILMLASTTGTPGINAGPAFGNSVFAVSLTNLNGVDGVGVPMTFSADLMDRIYKVVTETCEIDETAACISPRQPTTQFTLTGRESRSFAVWVGGHYSYTPAFFDMVRIRASVTEDGPGLMRGSTSVAHRGLAFRGACIGSLGSEPWSGILAYQTANDTGGSWQFDTVVHDLNFYSDGLGNIYAVPIDRMGARFAGDLSALTPTTERGCVDERRDQYTLARIADAPLTQITPATFAGTLRRGFGSIAGQNTHETQAAIVHNRLRAFYTNTDYSVHPIDFIPNNQTPTTPADGIADGYDAFAVRADGALSPAGSWQVTGGMVTGTLGYRVGADDISCDLALDHSGVVIPTQNNDQPPNPHYRVLDGSLANCTGGDGAAALAGSYHGLMIYQPLTSIGAPRENGLEMLLSRTDGEADYLLWFVLRTPDA